MREYILSRSEKRSPVSKERQRNAWSSGTGAHRSLFRCAGRTTCRRWRPHRPAGDSVAAEDCAAVRWERGPKWDEGRGRPLARGGTGVRVDPACRHGTAESKSWRGAAIGRGRTAPIPAPGYGPPRGRLPPGPQAFGRSGPVDELLRIQRLGHLGRPAEPEAGGRGRAAPATPALLMTYRKVAQHRSRNIV